MSFTPNRPALPRFTRNAAAETLCISDAALGAGLVWLSDNAGDDFADSLRKQFAERNALTEKQWRAIVRRANEDNANAAANANGNGNGNAAVSGSALPVVNRRLSLSPVNRSKARKAIIAAPEWNAYAKSRGINSAQLSGEALYAAADALGVDVAAAINASNSAARAKASRVFAGIGSGVAGGDPATGGDPAAGGDPATGGDPVAPVARIDWQRVREIARDEAANAIRPTIREVVIVQSANGAKASLGEEPTHPQFRKLVQAASIRDFSKNRLNIYVVGPTGTGKSYACRQLGRLLNLPVVFQSIAIEPYDLVGYVQSHNGQQKITPFVQAFRDGGICLLDEVDRYEPKASVVLNAALANGELVLDNGEIIKRHPDFICVCSGNTFGFGNSADFTAAEKMDLSTVSRLAVRIDWPVCEKTEEAIVAHCADNPEIALAWLREVRAVRKAMERDGLPYIADQRCVEAGANLLAAGMSVAEVREVTYMAPLDADQKRTIAALVASDPAFIRS